MFPSTSGLRSITPGATAGTAGTAPSAEPGLAIPAGGLAAPARFNWIMAAVIVAGVVLYLEGRE